MIFIVIFLCPCQVIDCRHPHQMSLLLKVNQDCKVKMISKPQNTWLIYWFKQLNNLPQSINFFLLEIFVRMRCLTGQRFANLNSLRWDSGEPSYCNNIHTSHPYSQGGWVSYTKALTSHISQLLSIKRTHRKQTLDFMTSSISINKISTTYMRYNLVYQWEFD